MLAFLYNVQCGMKPHHVASDPAILQHAWTWLLDLDVSDKIPGFKVSAVFFAALRANILLSETSAASLPLTYHTPALRPKRPTDADLFQRRPVASLQLPLPSQSHEPSNHKIAPRLDTSLHLESTAPTTPTTSTAPAVTNGSPRKTRPSTPPSPTPAPIYWLHANDTHPTRNRALHLLASSVSEQSHTAFVSLLTHPVSLIFWVVLLSLSRSFLCFLNPVACQNITISERIIQPVPPIASRQQQHHQHHHHNHMCQPPQEDDDIVPKPGETIYDVHRAMRWLPVRVVIAWTVLTVLMLLLARFASWMYKGLAREITNAPSKHDPDAGWLDPDDEIIVATASQTESALHTGYLDEKANLVGVVVLSWIAGSKSYGARRKKSGKAFIRAWAVRPDAQGKGIGHSLLKEVVRVCIKERGADGVWFAEDFAHAQRPLHALYNGPFRRRDIRARQSLASVIDEVTYRSGSSTHVYSHSHSHSNGGLRKR